MENSFDSIDRLLEFGMSMAVAQQMIHTMNTAMTSMRVPGADLPPRKSHPQYYVVVEGKQAGPLSEGDVERLVSMGSITADTLVWKPGAAGWAKAASYPELNKVIILNKTRKP